MKAQARLKELLKARHAGAMYPDLDERFGLPPSGAETVKLADQRALATEQRDLCAPHRGNWQDLHPAAAELIAPLGPKEVPIR